MVDWSTLSPVILSILHESSRVHHSGICRARVHIFSSRWKEVLLYTSNPMLPSGSRIGFGQGGFGTNQASQYILYRAIHLDIDCLDTQKLSATSVTDFFFSRISRTACVFIAIYLSHWNLGHIGEKDYRIYRLTPTFLLSYPIYLDISIEEDVNLIAAIVTNKYLHYIIIFILFNIYKHIFILNIKLIIIIF